MKLASGEARKHDSRPVTCGSGVGGTTPLLRQYFHKRTNLAVHGVKHVSTVTREFNTRPRKTLAKAPRATDSRQKPTL